MLPLWRMSVIRDGRDDRDVRNGDRDVCDGRGGVYDENEVN